MKDLLAKLEAATEGNRKLDAAIADHIEFWPPEFKRRDYLGADKRWNDSERGHPIGLECPNYTTSLDAAMTLVPDGYAVDLAVCVEMGSVARVYFGPIRENSAGEPTGRGNTPALALCIAALKARLP